MEVKINEGKANEGNVRKVRHAQNNKKKKNKIKVVIFIIVIVFVIIDFFIIKNKKARQFYTSKAVVQSLVGRWTSDGNTIYEFNDDGSGALVVPILTIPFSYKIDDNIIYVDFENEDSEDTNYEYLLEDNKLVLKNVNGTFEFVRIENEDDI